MKGRGGISIVIGIYKIYCEIENKIYIGSSESIYGRFKVHKSILRAGAHHSYRLQDSYDRLGEEAFVFEIIEECHPSVLSDREDYYINLYQAYNPSFGYNILPTAYNKGLQGRVLFNKVHYFLNPKGEKIEVRDLPDFCKRNNLVYSKMLSVSYGDNRYVKEGYRKYSEQQLGISFEDYLKTLKRKLNKSGIDGHPKHCKLINPNGEIIEIYNVTKFARDNNLSIHSMKKVSIGKQFHHKGWRNYSEELIGIKFEGNVPMLNLLSRKSYAFIDLKENIYKGQNMNRLCIQKNYHTII